MIGNTLKLLTTSKTKGDRKTSKTPQTLHSNLTQSTRKERVANFSQLLSEAKDVKKSKNSSKIQKVSVRKKVETPSLTPTQIVPLHMPIQTQAQSITPSLKSVKNTSSVRVNPNKQSTQEQLLLHKQSKTPQMAKKHIQTPLNEVLAQARKPKAQKEQKTLGDVVKIAEDNKLNLTKLEITSENPKTPLEGIAKPKKESRERVREVKVESKNPEVLSKISQKIQKNTQKESVRVESGVQKQEVSLQPQTLAQALKEEPQNQERTKDFTLSDLLKVAPKEKGVVLEAKEENKIEEKNKESKPQEMAMGELKRDTQLKINSSRETLTQFSQRIREEILNYKPPFTRLSMELNPVELGKLEITITKKGKELVINVNANNPNALHAFMQNQNEFRATLSNVGFNNVELNFSQGEGGEKNPHQEEKKEKRNKNSLEETITEIPALASMEIKMVQYA
ncbi:flagellar hook-length control protein FliK [Helicobacter brantae]|uniref:Flagellar hook-length control protein-like C-terminal domain-containing protein n=1 Tax=Helicobacter brantae TaxID=375927 RepID=A0A3D8J0R5_9HELI|nr:flagellar hook-length control protein FliK [Helicobacter brantae]RDU71107.1 hypothetical protein CQA58_03060 [Helicobacter brantae]